MSTARAPAGDRLHVQMLVPVLPLSGSVVQAFAVVAQSLPYSADVHKLPFALPAGLSAVVAPPPTELVSPVADALDHVRYYPGPTIDTKTLVGDATRILSCGVHTTIWASMSCKSASGGRCAGRIGRNCRCSGGRFAAGLA